MPSRKINCKLSNNINIGHVSSQSYVHVCIIYTTIVNTTTPNISKAKLTDNFGLESNNKHNKMDKVLLVLYVHRTLLGSQ